MGLCAGYFEALRGVVLVDCIGQRVGVLGGLLRLDVDAVLASYGAVATIAFDSVCNSSSAASSAVGSAASSSGSSTVPSGSCSGLVRNSIASRGFQRCIRLICIKSWSLSG